MLLGTFGLRFSPNGSIEEMLTTISAPHGPLSAAQARALVPRAVRQESDAQVIAAELVDDVRKRGVEALQDHGMRFDGGYAESMRVPVEVLAAADASLDPDLRDAILTAIERVRAGSVAQVPAPTITEVAPGAIVEQHWVPVERVGLYVPGGKAVYPSSVVMNVVAAQVAGVDSIALVSPAQKEFGFSVHPTIAAVAHMLGVTEVYAIGGASAIGALAYGVPELGLEPVSVITGPGNAYVAAAKRVVSGVVGIDSEAGPTEILIIADNTASPDFVAADLVSQAEHDELASAVLVTDSVALAAQVSAKVTSRVTTTPHRERVTAALMGAQSRIIIVDSIDDAIRVSDAYAPEHLEIHTRNAEIVAARIRNAGAIFVGSDTPVSLGDYLAGSNHVLPTNGNARHAAALGPATFLRPRQTVRYTRDALRAVSRDIVTFAHAENLPAHGDAVTARFER
ncbi:MAG: histidinol dehydrogenase [Actinomycetota bacterium]